MSISASVPQRLVDSVDESSVMAYVKDLAGHYLHVNQRYEEFFDIGVDDIRGQTDDGLDPRQTVDGPRHASGSVSEDEPLQLEYTVAPFDGRPALAVWRFAVRAADGDAVALCGVAAPVADAALARQECDRLMAIAQQSNEVSPPPVEKIDEGPTDAHQIAALHEASAAAARRAHELLSELTAERERRAEAESRAGEGDELRRRLEAAEAATLAERARAEDADSAAQRERERADEAAAELGGVRAELASVRGRFEAAEAEAQRQTARAEEAEASAQRNRAWVEDTLAELNAARGELASVRGRLEGAEAAAQRETARAQETDAAAHADRARADQLLSAAHAELEATVAELNDVRARLQSAEADLASERARRSQTEEEVVGDLRRRLEEADEAVRAERARVQETAASLSATSAELQTARAELVSERDQRTTDESELVTDLRRKLEHAVAELTATRTELQAARQDGLADDLRRRLEDAASSVQRERERADAAEAALNSERADAEIRMGVAERRIAELEAALGEARAHQLEVETEHGPAGPRWDSSAQRAFTRALSESSDWRISVKSAIGVIGSQGGWDAVCAWQPDDRNGFASCFAMWTGENRRLGALETATWQRRQPLTDSTIGQALTWEESQWLTADPRAADRRLQLLAQHGIRGALIVPVKDGARPVAALELLTVGASEPSCELVDVIETMALQLGHFSQLLSAGAQHRWRFGRV